MEFLRMSSKDFQKYVRSLGNKHNTRELDKKSESKDNKYHAKKTKIDGKVFDSTKESKRYVELKALQQAGAISGLECQKRFELVPNFEYRGVKMRGVVWIADFYFFNGREWVAEDVKSKITRTKPEYRIKMKLFMQKYPEILFNEYI